MSRSIKLVPTEEEPLAEITTTKSGNASNSSPISRKRIVESLEQNEEVELENDVNQMINVPDDFIHFEKITWTTSYYDNVLLADLDAYNYAVAFLFQDDALKYLEDKLLEMRPFLANPAASDAQTLISYYRRELLSNPLLFQFIERSAMHNWPTRTRLNIASACLSLQDINTQREILSGLTYSEHPDKFHYAHIRSSFAFQRLINCITSGSILASDFSDASKLFVQFKVMKFYHRLTAMKRLGNQYEFYNQNEAIQLLSDTIVLTRLDQQCIPQNLIDTVNEALEGRVLELTNEMNTLKGIRVPKSSDSEAILMEMLGFALIEANKTQMPTLFPDSDPRASARTKRMAREILENIRKTRGNTELLDMIGLAKPDETNAQSFTFRANAFANGKASKRTKWSPEEDEALAEGIFKYGTRWATIKERDEANILSFREPSQLKDRARNIAKRLLRENQDLGVFSAVTMKIAVHQKPHNQLIAIYTSPTLLELYQPKLDSQSSTISPTVIIPTSQDLNLNAETTFTSSKAAKSKNDPYALLNADERLNPALKVFAFENHRALMKTLLFYEIIHIHDLQKDKLNLKDFSTFYNLLASCSSRILISRSGELLNEKCFCEVDFGSRKIDFIYCPIEGIKSTLLSLSLDTELDQSEAYMTVLNDLNEYAKETETHSMRYKQRLDDTLKTSGETMTKYEELVNKVEIRETQIFMQFVLLLNEKKKKIRELTAELEELKKDANIVE